jgi:hypothetical protein
LRRIRAVLAALALATITLLGAGAPPSTATAAAVAVRPGPHDDGPHPPLISAAQAPAVRPHLATRPTTVRVLDHGALEISGLDLHDTSLTQLPDGRVAMYGSMYGCGYQWYVSPTPWCGFGVSVADNVAGPWSTPVRLFSPSDVDPWSGLTWAHECGDTGQGCFNPRMVYRSGWGSNDGTWILWFNSPVDYSRSHANALNAMGCNSATGPCGPGAGAPHGSYTKPGLSVCSGNGDFGIISSGTPGQAPAIVCTMPGAAALNLERLNQWGVGGDGTGVRGVAGLANIEGPGGYWDDSSGQYVLTFSDPGCGYCAGTGTGYATAPSLYSGWVAPSNVGFGPTITGRRDISATSCGGQPRTVSVLSGQAWQIVDTWTGDRNETNAGTILTPLTYGPTTGAAGDGARWAPPVSYPCS